ncbi:MAG TPA: undecaprenyldiphospho-muramoylpentapeptide beta-N-acetylglucosaminyltransferase [Polyangia bacterium]|nr:undecaprenyldiphospho-muramoylpentapeptide beta-N-acetylglucosaminyltransferase [Polyangia bacterium]
MKVIIAGGGTGGHLFPGMAVAEELVTRGHDVRFVGAERGIEKTAVPKAGYELDLIDVVGIKNQGFAGKASGLMRAARAMRQARSLLKQHDPDVVMGVGGYASGPFVLAAALGGWPTAIHEQNSVPGITNQWLARFVKLIFGTFQSAEKAFSKKKFRLVGLPVRKRVRDALANATGEGASVLVVGGSQGAHAVNELVFEAMKILKAVGQAPRILHQTGVKDYDDFAKRYAEAGIEADVRAFIDDMGAAYRDAAVVVARAGASTIAELTIIGRAAILIPLPFGTEQTVNAQEMAAAGAARCLLQPSTTPVELAEVIRGLLEDRDARRTMADASRALGRPRAHVEIADAIEALAR